jgi:outer membrane protein, heavy metal efflux system
MRFQILVLPIVVFLSFLFNYDKAFSQQSGDANNPIKLEDYLRIAVMQNKELESAFERWKAALEQIPQAKALPDPEMEYGKFVRQSDMQMNQMMSLMQMIPWFGKIEARTDTAYANAQVAGQEFIAKKLKLYQQVKNEYYEFSYLKEAIDTAQQNLELIKHFEQVARTKYVTSTGTHPDIIRAQIELAQLDEILVSLRELKKPQTARLNALLNRPVTAELDWPPKQTFTRLDMDFNRLVEQLKEKNPELNSLDWMIKSARSDEKLAKKEFYPDMGLGVEWTQFEKSGGMSGRDSVAVIFKMNLPLWRDSYKAAERQARANVISITQQKKDTENNLTAQVASELYYLEESQRKINLYENIIPRVEQLINASETAYSAGTIDFLSLIDSQRMLLQYKLDYQRVLTDNQQKLAALEMLIGSEISATKNQQTSESVLK